MRKTDAEVLAYLRENVIDHEIYGLGSEAIFIFIGGFDLTVTLNTDY
jgi:hypothetical protein